MNNIFFGTPDVCIPFLDALKHADMTPELIVTAPDRPAGRGNILTAPAVKLWAEQNGVPCVQPEKIDSAFIKELEKNYQLKTKNFVFLVVAYGVILPQSLIELPSYKTLNVHFSLLPRWRGASPVESALLAGDNETGCAIQIMRPQLDTGPLIALEKTAITETETAPQLRARLAQLGAHLLVQTLPAYQQGVLSAHEQDDKNATYAGKIKKTDGDITHDNDEIRWKKYRAYHLWPQTFFFVTKNDTPLRVKVTQATYTNKKFIIERVIPEGKKEMRYEDFLRG